MDKRLICGNDGLEVSLVGLGCNAFGNRIDEASTHRVVDAAIDSGINFMDTAESYGDGKSETFMGTGLKGKRNHILGKSQNKLGGGCLRDDQASVFEDRWRPGARGLL